jgi:predicted nucleic acid-binding Zn finger protein
MHGYGRATFARAHLLGLTTKAEFACFVLIGEQPEFVLSHGFHSCPIVYKVSARTRRNQLSSIACIDEKYSESTVSLKA